MWCIPPQQNATFVARMEALLDLYQRPYNRLEPVLCMDESLKDLQIATYFPLQTLPDVLLALTISTNQQAQAAYSYVSNPCAVGGLCKCATTASSRTGLILCGRC